MDQEPMPYADEPKPQAAQSTDSVTDDNGNRHFKRAAVLWNATLDCGETPVGCQVFNVSAGGAKLRVSEPVARRSMVRLEGYRFGSLPARIVWQQDDWVGLSFIDEPAQVADTMSRALPSLAA